jgi:predicted O-methyltransferase YrrM
VGAPEHPALRGLRIATAKAFDDDTADMQSGPAQAAFFQILLRAIGARRALEVGTFTGYGTLAIALALPADGQVVTCDVNEDWGEIGRPFWREAGVEARIERRIGPALDNLDALLASGAAESFDFAFVDADKKGYDAYFERALLLVKPKGLIALDNTLWGGRVADPAESDHQTVALRTLNAKLRDDGRIDVSLLPIADGVTLARKRTADEAGG